MILKGEKCQLKPIDEIDVVDHVDGLNSREIMEYSGISKTLSHTIESTIEWINETNKNPNKRLFGIFSDSTFIGTIRIDIDWIFRVGIISLVITSKKYHRYGIGTDAIVLISDFAFNDLMLHKLEAGILDGNIASIKAFKKAGYLEEGRKKENRILNGKYVDVILMGKINGYGH